MADTTVNAEAATGTGAAGAASSSVAPNAQVATGTGVALAPSRSIAPHGGLASGSGVASAPKVNVGAGPGAATGTGAARQPGGTIVFGGGVECATGTGAAKNAAIVAPVAIEQWVLVVTDRAGNTVHVFSDADDGAIIGLEGHDVSNEIGVGRIILQAEDTLNAYLVEDYLLHLYVRGLYVTTFIVRAAQVGAVESLEEGAEFARYDLDHILAVTEEGIVEPPGGMDSQPASRDRSFNFASPQLDDSTWTAAVELASFPSPPFPDSLSELPSGWPPTSAAKFIWSRDYDLSGGFHNMPVGTSYFRTTFTLSGAVNRQARAVISVDDNYELWIDGIMMDSYINVGIDGWGSAHLHDFLLSPGTHTLAVKGTNITRPGNNNNIAWAMFSVWTMVDGSDVYDTELVFSSSATLAKDYPATAPGFNPGEILLLTLAEEQVYSALTDVYPTFTGLVDTAGAAWGDPVDVSTKSLTGLDQFWVKELTDSLIDIDVRWNPATNRIELDAWVKGTHHPASGVTFTEGGNLGQFEMPQAERVVSSAACEWNDAGNVAFHTVESSPPAGHPVKRRPLSLGAARSLDQVERDGQSQIALFNRARTAPTLLHAMNHLTPAAELPPAYWKWSTVDVTITSRWLSSGTITLLSVSFLLREDGLIVFVPEAGDLIVPRDARAGQTLRRMAGGALGGTSHVSTPSSV